MASRRSGRRNKGPGKGMLAAVGLLLLGGAVGGWWFFGGDKKNTDATDAAISDLVPAGSTEQTGQSVLPPQSLAQVESLLTEVSTNLASTTEDEREGALRDGYKRLVTLLENPLPIDERGRSLELFHSITDELFLSPVHNEYSENVVVKSGDSFDRIARKYGISTMLLYKLNNRSEGSKNLHPGDNLKVPKGQPRLVVRKGDYTTSLYFGDNLVRQYIVAHGKNNNTPEGSTTIASMTVDPEKSARGPNDPRGEMKLRWIGLTNYAGGRTGIGFHGTQYPDSIPGMTSMGCMRMHDADVIELYDIVRIGNKVDVKA